MRVAKLVTLTVHVVKQAVYVMELYVKLDVNPWNMKQMPRNLLQRNGADSKRNGTDC